MDGRCAAIAHEHNRREHKTTDPELVLMFAPVVFVDGGNAADRRVVTELSHGEEFKVLRAFVPPC